MAAAMVGVALALAELVVVDWVVAVMAASLAQGEAVLGLCLEYLVAGAVVAVQVVGCKAVELVEYAVAAATVAEDVVEAGSARGALELVARVAAWEAAVG